jgi:hypothetical protein
LNPDPALQAIRLPSFCAIDRREIGETNVVDGILNFTSAPAVLDLFKLLAFALPL